jgi:hypothetical protein
MQNISIIFLLNTQSMAINEKTCLLSAGDRGAVNAVIRLIIK